MNFIFFCKLKKLKKHKFHFLQLWVHFFKKDEYGDDTFHVMEIELLEWGTVLTYNGIIIEWTHENATKSGYLTLDGSSVGWDNWVMIEDNSCSLTCTRE